VLSTKVYLESSVLPIKPELKTLFPTLLANGAEGMPQLFLKVDNEKGKILKSESPLKVSLLLPITCSDRLRAFRWLSRRWTQRSDGAIRHDQETSSRLLTFRLFKRTFWNIFKPLHGNQSRLHEPF